ncbi:DUF2809 domain-containing protein [Cellulomonas edaphi]|uniref:DUF2809 domain-containing protein n=1 Tax=Cellulomonas edaphi TaxID=3053468 RepID=A0ABT7S9N5_9CELL|nr:DUF2809 domain-containing protein [Cellulomons edaphi]MDM7832336.1 DUF2809 domain-containing protein [Cellulomons edaphi]
MIPSTSVAPGDSRQAVRRPRALLAAIAAVVVVAGLSVAHWGSAPWADPVGDALYASLVYVLVLVVAPRISPSSAALITAGACSAVELLQLTEVSTSLVESVPALRYVLGTTFSTVDLLVYLAAAALAALVDRALTRTAARKPGAAARGRG